MFVEKVEIGVRLPAPHSLAQPSGWTDQVRLRFQTIGRYETDDSNSPHVAVQRLRPVWPSAALAIPENL